VSDIAAVVLAAGASTRFGRSKQLLDWHGKPLVAHVADVALEAGLDPVIVVLGCDAEQVYPVLEDRPVEKLINWRWEEGMSTSVQTGLSAVPPHIEGALFLQCDQPLIRPDLLRRLVTRFRETRSAIVHPAHGDQRGTPVLFPRRFFAELARVGGDQGGRVLIKRHPGEAITVPVDDPDVFIDVDTPTDYVELKSSLAHPEPLDPASVLRPIRHLLIDMDGVLWRGDAPLPGLQAFFAFLHEQNIDYTLATNNASRTPDQYADKLAGFDVQVPEVSILTSSLVVAAYLRDVAPAGAPVYAIGEEGLVQALEDQGFVVTDDDAQYVVVGWDRGLTYQKLTTAAILIHRGAAFVGTNPDVTYPTEEGPAPGNGAILAAIEAATGVEPIVTGKPEPRMYEEALHRMGAAPETTAMIGDRIDTDIAGASRAGLRTILTLSGITTRDDLKTLDIKPDLVSDHLADLLAQWKDTLSSP